MIDVGDVYDAAVTIYDSAGAPADASAVTCAVTAPDGTLSDPHVLREATGRYRTGVRATMAGTWVVRWVATGTNASAHTDTFDVADPNRVPVVSLAMAKRWLNIETDANDEALRDLLDACSQIGEDYTGRVFGRRTCLDNTWGEGLPGVQLATTPVLAITEVTVGGVTLPASDYRLAPAAGILQRTSGVWPFGVALAVTYTAGYQVQPGRDVLGLQRLVKHVWREHRGSVQPGMSTMDLAPFGIPNYVADFWDLGRETGFA